MSACVAVKVFFSAAPWVFDGANLKQTHKISCGLRLGQVCHSDGFFA
jgi:hypothetical protein